MIIFVLEHMRVLTELDKAQRSEKGEGEQLGETGKDFSKEIGLELGPKGWGREKDSRGLDWTSPLGRWLPQFLNEKVGHSRQGT